MGILIRKPAQSGRIGTVLLMISLCACKSGKNPTDPGTDVGKGFLTVLPISRDSFYIMVNLGHLNQPGHTFPSDHGGFYLNDHMAQTPVFCPGDMTISRITATEHVNRGYTDYAMTLTANRGRFQIVMGHLFAIREDLIARARAAGEPDCEEYSTGGDTYRQCLYWTDIPVSAGDTIAVMGGNPGQLGMDFGVYDETRSVDFASNRFDEYLYPHSVSPLDYFTDEICAILTPVCGEFLCGRLGFRTKPPIGGTVGYDSAGTAQGLWFKPGAPLFPEDPHIALVYHNADPDIPVFSVGMSLTGLGPGSYTFTPADTGTVDRLFYRVRPDGRLYRYGIRTLCDGPGFVRDVLLVQMTDPSHLKIERQDPAAGPPWRFTANAVTYER